VDYYRQRLFKPAKQKRNRLSKPSPNYKIIPTENFLAEAKKLLKKYPNIKQDFLTLAKILKTDPITGNDYLGNGCYKIRMQITDKGGGQSGGARVIINVQVINKEVYVISTYDKGEQETVKDHILKKLLKKILPGFV
jgi:hypothetical protein